MDLRLITQLLIAASRSPGAWSQVHPRRAQARFRSRRSWLSR